MDKLSSAFIARILQLLHLELKEVCSQSQLLPTYYSSTFTAQYHYCSAVECLSSKELGALNVEP